MMRILFKILLLLFTTALATAQSANFPVRVNEEGVLYHYVPGSTTITAINFIEVKFTSKNKLGGFAGVKSWYTITHAPEPKIISTRSDSLCFIIKVKEYSLFNNPLLKEMMKNEKMPDQDYSNNFGLFLFESKGTEWECITFNQTSTVITNKSIGKDYTKGEKISVSSLGDRVVMIVVKKINPGLYSIIDLASQRENTGKSYLCNGYTFKIE